MPSLYKRATPPQARIMRAVEGAVKNASDAHGWNLDRRVGRSIAKRAAGTLSAQWPEVLAATSLPSDWLSTYAPSGKSSALTPCYKGRDGVAQVVKPAPGASVSDTRRRSPLSRVWKKLAIAIGKAKREGQIYRAEVLIQAIKIVAAEQQRS